MYSKCALRTSIQLQHGRVARVVNGYDSNGLRALQISYGFGRVGSNPALDEYFCGPPSLKGGYNFFFFFWLFLLLFFLSALLGLGGREGAGGFEASGVDGGGGGATRLLSITCVTSFVNHVFFARGVMNVSGGWNQSCGSNSEEGIFLWCSFVSLSSHFSSISAPCVIRAGTLFCQK